MTVRICVDKTRRRGSNVRVTTAGYAIATSEAAAIVARICTYYRRNPVPNADAALDEARKLIAGRGVAEIRELLKLLPAPWADHAIACVYAILMPHQQRKRLGVYFTPPHLVDHLLHRLDALRVDVAAKRFRDPAAGGAAFLVPLARRMVERWAAAGMRRRTIASLLRKRLIGSEIDRNLATLANALVRRMLRDEYGFASHHLKLVGAVVRIRDGLAPETTTFDHEIGNPPYRRLDAVEHAAMRGEFADIADGRLNLYAMFVRRALDQVPVGGLVGHVIPTSFVGGPEFAAFRRRVSELAEVLVLDVVEKRSDVFLDAIQDACFIVFRRRSVVTRNTAFHTPVSGILTHEGSLLEQGILTLPTDGSAWTLPVAGGNASTGGVSLREMGWRPIVGHLVANREPHRLHQHAAKGRYPLVWAAAVRQNGTFDFDRGRLSRQAAGRGYVDASPCAPYVIKEDCIVLQRTSSRSQCRRLVAALVPQELVQTHGGIVGENHTILLVRTRADAVPSDQVIQFLNSPAASAAFSRVGGSASISARLLAELPMPVLQTSVGPSHANACAVERRLDAALAGLR